MSGAVVLGLAVLVAVGGGHRDLRVRAMLLATAAGLLYGLQDTLTRSVVLLFDAGVSTAFRTWQPYGLLFIGALALLFAQSAFDAAPLRISLPASTAAEPLTGIALGVTIFGEKIRLSPVTWPWRRWGWRAWWRASSSSAGRPTSASRASWQRGTGTGTGDRRHPGPAG
ncbi:DMT family transporter [Actinomadura luteofluorescens]|uniref:DMT family transporter n=1 Tax=Actinomadura luteofluorescens TaxID=46163 RepID=UPI0036254BBF